MASGYHAGQHRHGIVPLESSKKRKSSIAQSWYINKDQSRKNSVMTDGTET